MRVREEVRRGDDERRWEEMKGEKVRRDRGRKTLFKCSEQYWIYQVLDDFELDINIPIL